MALREGAGRAASAGCASLRPDVPCTFSRDSLVVVFGNFGPIPVRWPALAEHGPPPQPERVPNWINSLLFSLHQGKRSCFSRLEDWPHDQVQVTKSLKQQRFMLLVYSAKDRAETLGFVTI
jgi:hypothetical protein